ncbi:hypothetical protein CHLRE_04g227526v5 [Chlamydomonas reinhardtii]|uniref:Uncharacterized protein n=1 Tax=Chlamydomonas reinhardtii TaxID=3055 RepID=A0A2K3DUQ5_CHLRE|nr:uncharacterized protein CHLRE_04g227526v5 [Chlamydomonas reinhardtii]PNW84268.1 hypothetical protein CHLRE_04g227526v5 [Chlamydomonas reinhardtii]
MRRCLRPQLSGAARLLLITSPKRETYKDVAKVNALMLYMPLWSMEELLACRSKLGLPVPEAFVKKCFERRTCTPRGGQQRRWWWPQRPPRPQIPRPPRRRPRRRASLARRGKLDLLQSPEAV